MRRLLKILLVMLILGGFAFAVVAALPRAQAYWKARNRPEYRRSEVVRGDIVSVVNATGRVEPVMSVHVGSFVSGPIEHLNADFNDKVQEGQLLAQIDDRIYDASKKRDEAALKTRRAEVKRVQALLEQARNDEKRAIELREKNPDYVSEAELDQLHFNRIALEAQLEVAEAAVQQAQANLENSTANLNYTSIKSPVEGIIIDRKIDPGQTLAAQFQTPELFVIAVKMDEEMWVHALVDEADIGLILDACRRQEEQSEKVRVEFTVDAYPNDLFTGEIYQVRRNPTETQNVVTYPVVVSAPNPQMKLLPGMTANLSFQIEKHENVLKIPNAALRFYPKKEQVRPEDQKILEGAFAEEEEGGQEGSADRLLSAGDRIRANRERNTRHVWVVDGDYLKAIQVTVGLSDSRYSELVEGDIQEGQKLVTGVRPPRS